MPPSAPQAPVRIMLVDDSAVIRGLYARMIAADPTLSVVASVPNGQMALAALSRQTVDVIVLDIEMPIMDGLTALPLLLDMAPAVQVIMSSTLTVANAEVSLKALQIGARDYIAKPTAMKAIHPGQSFGQELIAKIKALAPRSARPVTPAAAAPASTPGGLYRGRGVTLRAMASGMPDLIAIGASTGGPQALLTVMRSLKAELRQPILITQHMPATFTRILAEHIASAARRPCREAQHGEPVLPGHIYVAPGGHHMVVESDGTARRLQLLDTPPENFCRPAVDPMLRSLAASYGRSVLTVILTGMGQDGLEGAKRLVEAGGTVVAQDEPTSVVWGMPGAVATAGLCSAVLPLSEIAGFLNQSAVRAAA